MIYLAISIGFLGSLHCIGMCGPLAIGVSSFYPQSRMLLFSKMLSYNVGRILTYGLLGLILGALGQTIVLTGFQKTLSIVSGIFLIGLFILSLDIEGFLNKFRFYRQLLKDYNNWFSQAIARFKNLPSFVLGGLNGLLPCGLVYLALLGAMTSGSVENGALFMIIFGAGTLPAMMAIALVGREMLNYQRIKIAKVFPALQLFLGIYLIYRGIVVDMPQELDFYSLLAQPIRCH